jgi:DNA-directed RNA polymerase III subunit RPC5
MRRSRKSSKATELPSTTQPISIEVPDDDGDGDGDDQSSSSEGECEDDPVLKIYDVFVTDQLKDHTYLLQYLIRNPEEPYYDRSSPYTARIKSKEGILEVDVPLDQNNFSLLRGEKFAVHSQTEPGVKQDNRILDRQRLGGRAHENEASYFVSTVRGGIGRFPQNYLHPDQLHLSPVKATVQLRPSFHYYDTVFGAEKKKKLDDVATRQPRAIQVGHDWRRLIS